MGVEDNGGTGTRTETTDRPTTGDRPYTPPPDNPGSPGQQSRLDSRARTRQDQEQNKAQDTGAAQTTDTRPGGGTESTGSQGRPETGQSSRPAEQPRVRDTGGAQSGGSTPGSRDRAQPQVTERETDARTEPADKPAPPAQQYTLPADNPGSPGQLSRLESRARTRQDQQQNKPQDTQAAGPAPQPSGEQTGNRTPETPRPQDQEQQPLPRPETAAPADSGPPQGIDKQDNGPQEAETDTAPGTAEPRQRDAIPTEGPEPTPSPADGETDDGPASPSEATQTGQDGARPGTEAGQSSEIGGEPQEPHGDREAPNGESGGQQATDNPPSPPEETAEIHGPQEPQAEDDGDRGKKAEDDGAEQDPNETNEINPEAGPNPILSDVYTDSSGQVHVEPRYGREQTSQPGTELARNEPEATEPAELPTREDLDPAGAQGGEAGRGDLRDPEDDPADRNPGESNLERPSRRKDLLKEATKNSENIVDTLDKAVEGAFKALDARPPTGQPSTARDTGAHMDPVNNPVKTGGVTYGLLGAAIMLTQGTRWAIGKMREFRGTEHARNG